jgi:glycosyltransferase involved in cell wall biosynthesis
MLSDAIGVPIASTGLAASTATHLPRMSILTPCHNAKRYVVDAVQSVNRQCYPDLEHIVLDACSCDGTLSLLTQYPRVTVISEPDSGAHDAMNKGIVRARGEIIGFLNTDDLCPDDVLIEVGTMFAADSELDVVIGHSIIFEEDTLGQRRVLFTRTHGRENGLWLPELTFGVPGFNGCFFRRRVFDRVGNFDNDYFITADRQFLMRIALSGLKARWLDRPTILYRRHAESRTINPEMRYLMAISKEFFAMALEFGRHTRDRPDAHRVFLAWHAFEGVKLFVRSLFHGRFREAIGVLSQLTFFNPLCLLRLPHALALRHAVRKLDTTRSGRAMGPDQRG